MVKDEPGWIGNYWSEVSLCHPDNILWFFIMDETHHTLSNRGLKGGSMTQRSINATILRSGDRIIETNRHTTGVYESNPLEALPPCYIYDTKSSEEMNFKISPEWCKGLPKVQGWFGHKEEVECSSSVACRPKKSMDTSLFQLWVDQVLKVCYPHTNKVVKRDETLGMAKGPLILKTDSGPGRL